MSRTAASRHLTARLIQLSLEAGVLILVFAPLDWIVAAPAPDHSRALLFFISLGLLFVIVPLGVEYRSAYVSSHD